jgi:hypothetical protein
VRFSWIASIVAPQLGRGLQEARGQDARDHRPREEHARRATAEVLRVVDQRVDVRFAQLPPERLQPLGRVADVVPRGGRLVVLELTRGCAQRLGHRVDRLLRRVADVAGSAARHARGVRVPSDHRRALLGLANLPVAEGPSCVPRRAPRRSLACGRAGSDRGSSAELSEAPVRRADQACAAGLAVRAGLQVVAAHSRRAGPIRHARQPRRVGRRAGGRVTGAERAAASEQRCSQYRSKAERASARGVGELQGNGRWHIWPNRPFGWQTRPLQQVVVRSHD